MDFRALDVFIKLAETRHFGRTASLCNLSPSAVSRQLQRLEQSVGQPLVSRNNRQVHLTPAGRRFLDYARTAILDWSNIRNDLSATRRELAGEVSVFASVTASFSMLAKILPRVQKRHPKMDIKLRTGDQADGIERVLSGRDDCAIIARPDELSSKLRFLPLRTTPLVLIGPPPEHSANSSLVAQLEAKLQEPGSTEQPNWSTIPMVLAERGLARERFLERLRVLGHKPQIYAQVAGHEAVVSMVSLGFGVAVVPELVIEHSPPQARVRKLPWFAELAPFQLGLCATAGRTLDPILNALWSCAREVYPQPESSAV